MRTLIPLLAITLGLMVAGSAAAQPADQSGAGSTVVTQDLRTPDQVAGVPVATQDLRTPDQVAGVPVATQDLRTPDQVSPVVAPQAASTPDGGPSTALIALLAVGGAVLLASAAVVGTRYAQAHGHWHRHVTH